LKVLDKGEVKLLDRMGGDGSVIAAARVSNGVDYESASKGTAKDQGLINFLIKNRHGSPFEHAAFQFYIKTPMFVRSQWHRHRMASYNEISGRYVEWGGTDAPLEFYIPEQWRVPAATNKQGSVNPSEDNPAWNPMLNMMLELWSKTAGETYADLIELGVAKEMARMVLPVNLYTQFYMTVNARALMNFLNLRAAEDAQWEIRQFALTMRDMLKDAMPMTYSAWERNDFIVP
jgi:thymidylate synthase (FAD)